MRRSTRPPRLCIGCSGWSYASWRGRFYPATLRTQDWFEWYGQHFASVEINNSFYRLPEESTFADWKANSPAKFLFAVKASRYLTHMKQLRDPDEPLRRFFQRARALGRKLGPVLYQLPARLGCDLDRLQTFLDALPPRAQHVIEFRHPSWYVRSVFDHLERRGVALCLHDKEGSAIGGPFVGPFAYVRFHGTSGRYHGSYSDEVLAGWAKTLTAVRDRGRDVYAYFNNDIDAHAPRNALTLQHLCGAPVAGRTERPRAGARFASPIAMAKNNKNQNNDATTSSEAAPGGARAGRDRVEAGDRTDEEIVGQDDEDEFEDDDDSADEGEEEEIQ